MAARKVKKVKGRKELLVVITLTIFATTYMIINYLSKLSKNNIQNTINTNFDCSYEDLEKESYLDKYIVEEGDSLLTIALNELGSNSRVNEIIELNKDTYSELSVNTPFLEVGWEMYLPPAEFGVTSGKIFANAGKISEIEGPKITLQNTPDRASYGIHYVDTSTIFSGKLKEEFAVGDCVYITTDIGKQAKALKVVLQ